MEAASRKVLIGVVLLSLLLRGGIAVWKSDELTEDRDAYLGIAAGVADGRGYSSPGSIRPTAYRPPLYPLLLAIGPQDHIALWVAALNLLAGAATTLLTYSLALRMSLGPWPSLVAATLVAVDPLLVRYAAQPMTESVCTCLVTGWLWQTMRSLASPSSWNALLGGVLFGLAALCRPTVWLAGGLVGVWVLWLGCRGKLPLTMPNNADSSADGTPDFNSRSPSCPMWSWRPAAAALLGCLIIVLPWPLRNYGVLGAPVVTTTHGGYTLLLGNNPVFFHEFARHPREASTTLIASTAHDEWMLREQRSMQAAGVRGEIAEDRWMASRAWEHIAQDKFGFLAACALREYWFWNVVPLRESRTGWPGLLLQSVGLFYSLLWIYGLLGLFGILTRRVTTWVPGLLIIVAFASAHLIYWSNARMRAPLVPILALLAVYGFCTAVRYLRSRSRRDVAVEHSASADQA